MRCTVLARASALTGWLAGFFINGTPYPWLPKGSTLGLKTVGEVRALIYGGISVHQMTNPYNVAFVGSVVGTPAHERPIFIFMNDEENRPRVLKYVGADVRREVTRCEFHGAC